MHPLTPDQRSRIRTACRVWLFEGCPHCAEGGPFVWLLNPDPPCLTYLCLEAIRHHDPEGYADLCQRAETTSPGYGCGDRLL